MMIYVCLSGHGYGHAARQASLLEKIHKLRPDLRLVISSSVDLSFLKLVLKGVKFEYRKVLWDIGVVQRNALEIDLEVTISSLNYLHEILPRTIQLEAEWIKSQNSSSIIVADIPPSAIQLAEQVDAPLLWVGNFGWDEIYKPFGGEFSRYSEFYQSLYKKGEFLLRCPFSLSMNWGVKELSIGLTASKPKSLPTHLKSKLLEFTGPIVMIGFGGFGYKLNYELFNLWPNHLFLMAQSTDRKFSINVSQPKNLIFLPLSNRVIDALPFCSRHLGKPGYSSFCEAMSLNIGLHVFKREGFAESKALISGLKKFSSHRLLDQSNLLDGNWELDLPLNPSPCSPLVNDGADTAAKIITKYVDSIN